MCSRLVAFSVLYKVHRYKDAIKYAAQAAQTVNQFVDGSLPSRLSKVACLNLYGIVVICLASALLKQSNDRTRALKLLDEAEETCKEHSLAVNSLMEQLRIELEQAADDTLSAAYSSLPLIGRTRVRGVVSSAEFDKVFFIVIFIPFIGANTPRIKSSELEHASSNTRFKNMSAVDLTRLLLNKRLPANSARLPRDFSDNYINLIASVVETPRSTVKARSTQSRIVLKDKYRSLSHGKRKPFKSATSPGAPLKSKLGTTRPRRKQVNKSFAVAKTHRIFNKDVEHLGYSFDRRKANSTMMVEFNLDSPRKNFMEVVPLKSGRPPRYKSQRTPKAREFQF